MLLIKIKNIHLYVLKRVLKILVKAQYTQLQSHRRVHVEGVACSGSTSFVPILSRSTWCVLCR